MGNINFPLSIFIFLKWQVVGFRHRRNIFDGIFRNRGHHFRCLFLEFFDTPAFQICEITDLTFIFPLASADIEIYFYIFIQSDIFQ